MTISTYRLMQISALGGFSLVGVAKYMQWKTMDKFKKSDIFKLSVSYVENSKPLMQIIGDPIAYGKLDMRDTTKNYTTDEDAKFAVPLKGSKARGTLFIHATRQKLDTDYTSNINLREDSANNNISESKKMSSWNLQRLEIELSIKPGFRVLVYPSKQHIKSSES